MARRLEFDLAGVCLFSRLLVGLQFGMAGAYKVFVLTPARHASELFVGPYEETWIPRLVLLGLGLAIPYLELIGGVALVVGWRRRWTAVALCCLLVVVTYGHLLLEPFYQIGVHVLPRFVLLLPSLAVETRHDRWSLEAWLQRRSDA